MVNLPSNNANSNLAISRFPERTTDGNYIPNMVAIDKREPLPDPLRAAASWISANGTLDQQAEIPKESQKLWDVPTISQQRKKKDQVVVPIVPNPLFPATPASNIAATAGASFVITATDMDTWFTHARHSFPAIDSSRRNPDPRDDITPTQRAALTNISKVSEAFQLNEKQHQVFTYMATSFLLHLFFRRYNYHTEPAPLHHIMFGPAGTGKSAVIKAMKFLAKIVYAQETFLVMAATGVAAINIDGITLDKYIFRNHGYKPLPPKTLEEQLAAYPNLIMICLDEMSFLGHTDLTILHLRLAQLYGSTGTQPFGGLNIVLSGDFLQLPKVKSTFMLYHVPVFIFPATQSNELVSRERQLQGFKLFRLFRTATELTEVLRQNGSYRDQLNRFRNGQLTPQDVREWNTRVIGTPTCPTLPTDISVKTATMLNGTRTQISSVTEEIYRNRASHTTGDMVALNNCPPILLQGTFTQIQPRKKNTPGDSSAATSAPTPAPTQHPITQFVWTTFPAKRTTNSKDGAQTCFSNQGPWSSLGRTFTKETYWSWAMAQNAVYGEFIGHEVHTLNLFFLKMAQKFSTLPQTKNRSLFWSNCTELLLTSNLLRGFLRVWYP